MSHNNLRVHLRFVFSLLRGEQLHSQQMRKMRCILIRKWRYIPAIFRLASIFFILTLRKCFSDRQTSLLAVGATFSTHDDIRLRNSFYIFRHQRHLLHFKACCTNFVLFSTKCHLLHNLIFSCQIIVTFFIKHVQRFKYPLCRKSVNYEGIFCGSYQ